MIVDDSLVAWSEIRAIGYVTYFYMAGADFDYLALQTVSGTHYWFGVDFGLEGWWHDALSGLPDPPTSLSFVLPVIDGIVEWPPADRGRPMYAEETTYLFGFLPWSTRRVALVR